MDVELLRYKSVTGIINAFKVDPNLKMKASGLFPERTIQGQTVTWDIQGVQRDIAKFQGKHSPAQIRRASTIGQQTARLARTFIFQPVQGSYMLDLRQPGSLERERLAQNAIGQAELTNRQTIDRQDEYMLASAAQGSLAMTIDDLPVTIDYGIPADNQLAVGDGIPVAWSDGGAKILKDLELVKQTVKEASGYTVAKAWCGRGVLRKLMENETVKDFLASTPQGVDFIQNGSVSRFFGISWEEYDGGYLDDDGNFVPYIPDNRVIFVPTPSPDVAEMVVGTDVIPGDDNDQSMVEVSGLYSYVRGEHNPAGLNFYAGKVRFPILKTPGAFLLADVA